MASHSPGFSYLLNKMSEKKLEVFLIPGKELDWEWALYWMEGPRDPRRKGVSS